MSYLIGLLLGIILGAVLSYKRKMKKYWGDTVCSECGKEIPYGVRRWCPKCRDEDSIVCKARKGARVVIYCRNPGCGYMRVRPKLNPETEKREGEKNDMSIDE